MNNKIIKYSTASLYVLLYIIVATISCICSIDFFNMTHNNMSSIILSISFEIGSMGCLFGALTTLKNKNNVLIWVMFIFLTLMQMMNNTYYAYVHVENYQEWSELFDLIDLEAITQKRIISIISGCVLPLVSLSFIHLLVDLLKDTKNEEIIEESIEESFDDTDDGYDFTPKEEDFSNAVIHDAEPLTEEQEKEYDKNRKKRPLELAKNEMEIALDELKKYKNELNK